MFSPNLFQISKEEKEKIIEKLIQKSYPGMSFYIMIALASFIAAVGLMIDNLIIIVGSILIAPFLYPIIFLGMSIVLDDFKVIKRTLLIIGKIIALGLSISFFSTLLLSPFVKTETPGIFQEISFLPLFYIAIASGLAATFAISRKSLVEYLPGVAVSISLILPLITIGVAIALGKFALALHCFQLFLINIFGIIFAAILIFSLMGFARERKVARETLKEEKKSLEKGEIEFEKKKRES